MSLARTTSLALAAVAVAAPLAVAAPASAAVSPWASCADVAHAVPGAPDGEYQITVFGRTLEVWCADLAAAPVEYLSLVATSGTSNTATVGAGNFYAGTTTVTDFTRVRLLLPATASEPFSVQTDDLTFSTSTGDAGGYLSTPYGSAGTCGGELGRMDVDLTGTPLGVSSSSFAVGGWAQSGAVTQVDGQHVEAWVYGLCGHVAPVAPLPLTWLGAVAPFITTAPANAAVDAGDDVTFTAAAAGDPVVTQRWQVSSDGGASWADVPGATSPSLVLPDVTTAHDGVQVRSLFTNAEGTAASPAATLTVAPVLPTVTAPADAKVDEGGTATFTVTAAGDPAPTLQWQRSTDDGATWQDVTGAAGASLSLADVDADDDGLLVRVVATNAAGPVASSAARLTVVAAAVPAAGTGPASGAALAATGSEALPLVALSGLLLLAGAGALVVRRRLTV